jgi:hypothetical protein
MLGLSQRGSQLRAAIKRVGTFAGLDLDELTGQLEALGLGEPGNGSRCASSPRPERPWRAVDTRM